MQRHCSDAISLMALHLQCQFLSKRHTLYINTGYSFCHMIMSILAFLAQSEGDITPASVLAFVTGASSIPPLGFDHTTTICFISDKSKTLPLASICPLVLRLPLALIEYGHFKERMDFDNPCNYQLLSMLMHHDSSTLTHH